MSEFFLELFSEEIPSNLQKNLRENLLKSFNIPSKTFPGCLVKSEDSFRYPYCPFWTGRSW